MKSFEEEYMDTIPYQPILNHLNDILKALGKIYELCPVDEKEFIFGKITAYKQILRTIKSMKK